MLRLTSLFLLALLGALAGASSFGRFGYQPYVATPGWVLSAEGIKADHPAADVLRFPNTIRQWRPVETSEFQQISLTGGGAGVPAKVRASLLALGTDMYFEAGLDFTVSSTASPFLSWTEGSVESGVPTPSQKWLLLSFRDRQPPILLVFEGEPASLTISGKPGQWRIHTSGVYQGWVRLCLPRGTEGVSTFSASSLGQLVRFVRDNIAVWSGAPPTLLKTEVQEEWTGVNVTYRFSRGPVPIPPAAELAPGGGYPLEILSRRVSLGIEINGSPISTTEGNELRLRFPVRRVPTGRGIGAGDLTFNPLATAAPQDVPSVVELALENLHCLRERSSRELGEKVMGEFIGSATATPEPFTKQVLLHGADGKGADLVAAHALLMQSLAASNQSTSEGNAMLTSLKWRRDWWNWDLGIAGDTGRRAAALAAIAGAICPEPERRLEAAMLQAGLAAERARQARLAKAQNQEPSPLLEVLEGVRRSLFLAPNQQPQDAWVRLMLSEMRAYGDASISAKLESPQQYGLRILASDANQFVATMAAGYTLNLENRDFAGFLAEQSLGITRLTLRAKEPGRTALQVKTPSFAKPLPALVAPPEYVEAKR